MLLDDVNEMFGTNIEEENIDTIGGWLSTQVISSTCRSKS